MASKTIIDLPVLSTASANTQNTVFVVWDKISGTTKQFTLSALDLAIGNASANAQSTGDAAFAKANSANTLAQNAYNQANTDYTTISTTAGVYGNAIFVPVITLAANGRVSSITNTAITGFANTTYAQAGFATANSAYTLSLLANTVAAAAYTQANSGTTLAQNAYNFANTLSSGTEDTYARPTANAAYAQANAANTLATTANVTGQAAFNKANSVAQYSYVTVVANGTNVVAASNSDTLTITANASNGIFISANATTDTIDIGLIDMGTAGTYGSNIIIPVITTTTKGRVSSVTNTTIQFSTTSVPGIVQLEDSTISTSTSNAATANSVKNSFAHANAAFNLANSVAVTANSTAVQASFDRANAAYSRANSAYTAANNSIITAGGAVTAAATANTNALSANTLAGTAYTLANLANTIATSSYAWANTINVKVDSAYANSNAVYTLANTANTVAASAYAQANVSNVVALSAYTQANSATVTAQAAFDTANASNGSYATSNAAYTHANSAFDTANSALTIAQLSYDTGANTALAAFAQANTATTTGQAAFNKANNAIANTSSVYLTGNLTVAGAVTMNVQQTNTYWIDPNRTDSYTENGTILYPYKTIANANSAAVASGHNDSNPAYLVLMGNATETVNLNNGGIFLTGAFSSGTHSGINLTGQININGTSTNIVDNHFSISNLRIIAPTHGYGVLSRSSNPQRVFMRDLWIDASGAGACVRANGNNSTIVHLNTAHLTHSNTTDVYCVEAANGVVTMTDIETSGSITVASVSAGANLSLSGSEIDANNAAAVEVYGGTVTITNSVLTNANTTGHGVALKTAGSVALLGNVLFNTLTGTNARAVFGVTGSACYYQYLSFYPGSNNKMSSNVSNSALTTTFSYNAP
jgi:hypothetical protein